MERPTLAALAVVTRDDHVILARRKSEPDAGLWGFPGGHVDFGERAEDAACRELFEETGVQARAGRILTALNTIVRGDDGTVQFHFFLVAVQCHYLSGDLKGRDDVYEAAWVPCADVLNRRLSLSDDVDTVLRLAIGPSLK